MENIARSVSQLRMPNTARVPHPAIQQQVQQRIMKECSSVMCSTKLMGNDKRH